MADNMITNKKIKTFDDYMETIDPVDRARINCKAAIMSKII